MRANSGKNAASKELQQVVAYILDTTQMTATITSLLSTGMAGFAKEMLEIDRHFPGFDARLRRQIDKEVRRTISQRIPGLRSEFEEFLGSRLTQDDLQTALAFQRERITGELRETAFIKSLKTDERSAALSERLSASMSSGQHAAVVRFLQSPCGVKLAPLTRQMETLKYGWMQVIVGDVSQRLPAIGGDLLRKHYMPPATT